MRGNPWVPSHRRTRGFPFIKQRRGSTEPRRATYDLAKRLKKYWLLLLLGGLLLCHHFLPPSLEIRTRGSIVRRAGSTSVTSWTIPVAPTSSATPRVSPRSLFAEVSETLAVVRNGARARVGSIASVVATTCSIAIQVVLIHRLHAFRQEIAKIFFRAVPGEMLRMRRLHHDSRHVEGPPAHRVRAVRKGLVRGLHRPRRGKDFARMAGSDACRAPQLTGHGGIRCE